MAGHIGTTHLNLYPLAGDDRALTLLKRLERADNQLQSILVNFHEARSV